MIVTHSFDATCTCPVDGTTDEYRVTIETDRVVPVEDILAVAADLACERMFQEQFTTELAQRLDVAVATFGTHSGVHTAVEVR